MAYSGEFASVKRSNLIETIQRLSLTISHRQQDFRYSIDFTSNKIPFPFISCSNLQGTNRIRWIEEVRGLAAAATVALCRLILSLKYLYNGHYALSSRDEFSVPNFSAFFPRDKNPSWKIMRSSISSCGALACLPSRTKGDFKLTVNAAYNA